jgi:hypothetical protein
MRTISMRILPLLFFLPALAVCQQGSIGGRVTVGGQSGVSTAIVTAFQTSSGWKRSVLTNQDGHYSLQGAPPGEYRLEAIKPGFKRSIKTGLSLRDGQPLSVDLPLAADPDPKAIAVRAASEGAS